MSSPFPLPLETDTPFCFSPHNQAAAQAAITRYPAGQQQSAILPLLHLAQQQSGWVSRSALEHIAQMLGMAPMKLWEIASFYTMIHLKPVGQHHVKVCTTTPCWLRGSDDVLQACAQHLKIAPGQTTPDGRFTMERIECLGGCVGGPVVQINDTLHEALTPTAMIDLLDQLKSTPFPDTQ